MNRPQRASSIASRATDDEVESLPVEQMHKKRRMNQVDIVQSVFDTIQNLKKEDGTLLCDSYIRAPKGSQEPTYYDEVSNPIDMIQIQQKINNNEYVNVDDLQADLELLTNNAKSFYKKNSQEYKDAVVLWDVFLTTKNNLLEREETPKEKIDISVGKLGKRGDSAASVSKSEQNDEEENNLSLVGGDDTTDNDNRLLSELLTSLFTNVFNHQDEEGHYFSDSMAELPEHDDVDGNKTLSLNLIKLKLDSNQYKQLDTFQDDLFAYFDRARQLSHTDSQIFKDSIELQAYFISIRDEVCCNGDLSNSPALNYSLLDLSLSVNAMRARKMPEECIREEEDDDVEDYDEEDDECDEEEEEDYDEEEDDDDEEE